jgi:hypothetical protein
MVDAGSFDDAPIERGVLIPFGVGRGSQQA